MFGCDLSKVCESQNSNVPLFLMQFMEYVEKIGLESEGIYRVSGNSKTVTELKNMVDNGK